MRSELDINAPLPQTPNEILTFDIRQPRRRCLVEGTGGPPPSMGDDARNAALRRLGQVDGRVEQRDLSGRSIGLTCRVVAAPCTVLRCSGRRDGGGVVYCRSHEMFDQPFGVRHGGLARRGGRAHRPPSKIVPPTSTRHPNPCVSALHPNPPAQ